MKTHSALLAMTLLFLAGSAGDAARNYASSPGSNYDRADNQPRANGAVTHDVQSPLVHHDYGRSGDAAARAAQ
jgi:hypothetical protein